MVGLWNLKQIKSGLLGLGLMVLAASLVFGLGQGSFSGLKLLVVGKWTGCLWLVICRKWSLSNLVAITVLLAPSERHVCRRRIEMKFKPRRCGMFHGNNLGMCREHKWDTSLQYETI